MEGNSADRQFVQFFSIWKLLALEAFGMSMAIVPLTPEFADGANFRAPLPSFIPYLFSVFGWLGSFAILPMLLHALRRRPAIEVTRDRVAFFDIYTMRSVPRTEILGIHRLKGGLASLARVGAQPALLHLSLYAQPSASFRKLRVLLSHDAGQS